MSRARLAVEVGGRAGVPPAPLAAAGAVASAPAAYAGGSGDSRLTTPEGVSGRGGPPSAVASIASCSLKSRKQEKSRRPSVDCSSRRPGSMRRSSLTVKRPWWLIQGTISLAGLDTMRGGNATSTVKAQRSSSGPKTGTSAEHLGGRGPHSRSMFVQC